MIYVQIADKGFLLHLPDIRTSKNRIKFILCILHMLKNINSMHNMLTNKYRKF